MPHSDGDNVATRVWIVAAGLALCTGMCGLMCGWLLSKCCQTLSGGKGVRKETATQTLQRELPMCGDQLLPYQQKEIAFRGLVPPIEARLCECVVAVRLVGGKSPKLLAGS